MNVPPPNERTPGEVVGYIECPFSGELATVKVNKKRALYYHAPGSGPVQIHGHAGQAGLERMTRPYHEVAGGTAPTPKQSDAASAAPEDDL